MLISAVIMNNIVTSSWKLSLFLYALHSGMTSGICNMGQTCVGGAKMKLVGTRTSNIFSE